MDVNGASEAKHVRRTRYDEHGQRTASTNEIGGEEPSPFLYSSHTISYMLNLKALSEPHHLSVKNLIYAPLHR